MANVGLRDLLESGVHFGHQTRRWNPKMKKYCKKVRGISAGSLKTMRPPKKPLLTAMSCPETPDISPGTVI